MFDSFVFILAAAAFQASAHPAPSPYPLPDGPAPAAGTCTGADVASSLVQCPIVFDGRVPSDATPQTFDTSSSPFSPEFTKGNNLNWSEIVLLPDIPPSRFDAANNDQAVEVTISDKSIFQTQKGFRRAGLQFANDSGRGEAVTGVKTLHWSVKQDPQRPMNLSHEYLNTWHETAAFDANQFMFQAGTIIGTNGSDKNDFKILTRDFTVVWRTEIDETEWQNFAVTMDYTKNTIDIYYSLGGAPLEAVKTGIANNNTGGGQYQIGMLKKPTGTDDVVNSGFQESGILEGQIYGGLFVEDSADGCVSL